MKANIHTRHLLSSLRKAGKDVALWRRIADDLEKSTRVYPRVNLYKLDKTLREGEIAVVAGKVLSLGNLTKKTTVVAFQFSDAAREKINKNGEALSIAELLAKNPKGQKVRIVA